MSPSDPRVVKVTIHGRDYAFASQGSETDERVRQAASIVDERMRTIGCSGAQTPMQVAVLAGLELVDELLKFQELVSSAEGNIAHRTSRLTDSLGSLLQNLTSDRTLPLDTPASDPDQA
ncbi:MAG: cell division protein ZapA [Candidatus Latescibacterota bacterium]|nr:cell division protein ZapA [Candidatus Latescibacterota bacterium]